MSERTRGQAVRRPNGAKYDWTARLRRAEAALDDTRAIARLALRERVTELCDQPAAEALVGRQALRTARAVGLFAGAFNPLTRAHIALAKAAMSAGDLDVIAWTLAVVTVDKERVERATLPDRLAQLEAFCEERAESAVVLVNRGLYVDQARALRTLMAPHARLAIVVGFDKVVQIFDPRYYADRDAALRELFAEAELLVAPRAGQGPHELERLLSRLENARFAAFVRPIPLAPRYAEESSSRVRALTSSVQAKAPRGMVAPEGWVLARLGAYSSEGDSAGAGMGADAAYAVRAAWERELPSLPASVLRTLPTLSALVARTRAPAGTGLRAWLDARAAGLNALEDLLG